MIEFIVSYTFTTRDYRQYSAIAILHASQFTVTHALGFSVFTSRILATDLSQSHYHFKSHMKSSLYSLIPFLPILLNHLRQPSPELDTALNLTAHLTTEHFFITTLHQPHRKHSLYFCPRWLPRECVYRVVA
jgi:hypothetical protein